MPDAPRLVNHGRPHRSFFWRLYLSYTAVVLVSAVIIGALVLENLNDTAVGNLMADLAGTARLLAATEAANPAHLWSAQLPQQVAEVATFTDLHLTYLLSNGRLLAESSPVVEATGETLLALPEIVAARTRRMGEARRDLGAGAGEFIFVAAPILLEYEVIGYVRVGVPFAQLAGREAQIRGRVAAGASLSALVALGLGFVFARNVTRPLERISGFCRRITAGHLDQRIGVNRDDEIGVVATTVNQMADELQRRLDDESRERQRLVTLFSVMTDGVVAINHDGAIAYLNSVAANLLGLDLANAVGENFRERARVAAAVAVYDDAQRSSARAQREVRISGHPHDLVVAVYAAPLHDAGGQPRGMLVVLHDLTEMRRLEEVRQTFSANVSHELKTPLTAIGSLVDAMMDDPEMSGAMRERFLTKISNQNERLQKLVQDLLTISRLESDREVLETEALHVESLVAPCLRTFAPVAQQKGVALKLHAVETPLQVRVNAEAGRLIVNNLLQNAVNYTPAGGAVTLTLFRVGEFVAIEVRDTGIGIAAEHLERIFERFYRADRSRTRNAGGVGLGLSIVKHLTGAMGGKVFVESEWGRGSVFTVHLPVAVGNREHTAPL